MTTTTPGPAGEAASAPEDVAADFEALYRDGIVARRGAFSRQFVEKVREDMLAAYERAMRRPRGAVSRGPQRWYVEIHPEEIRGFVELASHPWVTAMAQAVLGPDYRFVELGFDVPFQGAKNQPWHRDFKSPAETYRDRRITALAFNLTGVDVTPDMGPFEIAVGTHWDDGREWNHQMFPPRELWARYAERAVRKFPQMGDIACRTPLALHRGTEHASPTPRPVLILGLLREFEAKPEEHDLAVTREYHEALPPSVREHLLCRVVDELEPITARHDIEGLVMGVEA